MPDMPPPVARPEIAALAEHCFGGTYCTEPFTRITLRKSWIDGGTFIANIAGHVPDGTLHVSNHGRSYRLTLIGRRSANRAVAA
jgi:hypothetical protein